jgi:hypothetical protein
MKYATSVKKFSDGASANHTTQVSVVTSSSRKLNKYIYIVIKRRMKDNPLTMAYNFRFN